MARMTKAERAELERQLKEDDEAEDYDPPVKIGHADGSYDEMPYSLARKHHPDRYKDPEPPKADKDDGKDDGKTATRFAGRRIG